MTRVFSRHVAPEVPTTVPPNSPFTFDLEICTQRGGGEAWSPAVVLEDERVAIYVLLDLEGGGEGDPPSCNLDRPYRVNFGRTSVGETVTRRIHVRAGDVPCSLNLRTFGSGAFDVVTEPFTLEGRTAEDIDVTFTPTEAGRQVAVLQLLAGLVVELVGTGDENPAPPPYDYTSRSEWDLQLAEGGAEVAWVGGKDDGQAVIPIPFAFSFQGTPVSEVTLSTNGFITFAELLDPALINDDLPDEPAPNASIAWWWDDLELGETTYQVTGAAPDRILHLTFKSVGHAWDGGSVPGAEVQLFEADHAIEVRYQQQYLARPPDPTSEPDFTASAGWEGFQGQTGTDILGCTPTCTDRDWPSDVIYRFAP